VTSAEIAERAARRPRAFALPRPDLRGARGLLLPLVLLLAWAAASRAELFQGNLLPTPAAVVEEVLLLAQRGELWGHIWITVWRVAVGFIVGAVAATVLGALTGYSRSLRALLDPTLQALKSVPSLSWVPLFILWLGIFETSKIALIAVGVFFPVYLSLMSGVQDVDRKLVEVGRIYGLSQLALIRRVLLPATLPSWFIGLRAGLALGWMFVVAAELMGASEGLGFLMIDGQMTGRPAVIIASLILFAIAGKLSDWLLALASARALRWQDSFGREANAQA
jgi:sulfonate transport system permease protein